jgi:hypothetical protein
MLQGRVAAEGSPNDVVNRYVGHVLGRQADRPHEQDDTLRSSYRHGDGASRVIEVHLTNGEGSPAATVRSGEPVVVTVRARALKQLSNPVVGILIRNRLGIDVFGTNTRLQQRTLGDFQPGQELEVTFRFDCLLTQQEYTLTVATQHWDGSSQDWLDDVVSFSVIDSAVAAGLVSLKTDIEWRKI